MFNDYENVGLPRLNVVTKCFSLMCERTTYIVHRFVTKSQCKSRYVFHILDLFLYFFYLFIFFLTVLSVILCPRSLIIIEICTLHI